MIEAEVVGKSVPGHLPDATCQGVLALSAQKVGGLSLPFEL